MSHRALKQRHQSHKAKSANTFLTVHQVYTEYLQRTFVVMNEFNSCFWGSLSTGNLHDNSQNAACVLVTNEADTLLDNVPSRGIAFPLFTPFGFSQDHFSTLSIIHSVPSAPFGFSLDRWSMPIIHPPPDLGSVWIIGPHLPIICPFLWFGFSLESWSMPICPI